MNKLGRPDYKRYKTKRKKLINSKTNTRLYNKANKRDSKDISIKESTDKKINKDIIIIAKIIVNNNKSNILSKNN